MSAVSTNRRYSGHGPHGTGSWSRISSVSAYNLPYFQQYAISEEQSNPRARTRARPLSGRMRERSCSTAEHSVRVLQHNRRRLDAARYILSARRGVLWLSVVLRLSAIPGRHHSDCQLASLSPGTEMLVPMSARRCAPTCSPSVSISSNH